MIDPSKLIGSARRVFGDNLDSWYGEPLPINETRLKAVTDGSTIDLGNRKLQILHTPGHASHEITIVDEPTRCAFVGDTAGVFLGESQFRPATPPPEFDVGIAVSSIQRLIDLKLSSVAFTHYGVSQPECLTVARDAILRWDSILEPLHKAGATDQELIDALSADAYRGTDAYTVAAMQMNGTAMCVNGFKRYYDKLQSSAK